MAESRSGSSATAHAERGRLSRKRGFWLTVGLASAVLVALLGALLWRGGASLAFVVAFVVLMPLTLASALMQWWPLGRDARATCRIAWMRQAIRFLGVSLGVCAALTLVLGVAWSGSRVGNTLLVAGVALLPPAALVGLLAVIGFRAREPEDLLAKGERCELSIAAHWTVFVLPLLLLALSLALALGPFGVPGLAMAAALYLIGLPGTAGQALARFIHSGAVLGDRALHLSYGLFWQKTASLDRRRVQAVGVKGNAWIRALGLGKLSVVDDRGESIVVAGLRRPGELVRRLQD
ncbi:MAG: PH domain-containing protein [Wenzhouxiangella sp.]|nr:MAG: PH domain-containing protein [Wenzhouxiangella sp.]